LIAPLIDERKKLEEDNLRKTPRYNEIQMEIQSIRKQEHPALRPKFKQLVLESYFKKQKRHLRDIL
jgi:dihydroneopterin aldolase